ncbi:MAG: hypothetical protein FJX59_02590 [Alphaproteobacteria bacterium]|nr:hypothetical protein [Alphaproteobacteria bacterium]
MTTRRSVITAAAASALTGGEATAQTAKDDPKETIAILGTGRVGNGIGRHWVAAGHTVTFGSRTPTTEKAEELARIFGRKVPVTGLKEAVAAAAIILLAVPYRVARETLASLGDLTGKILIDPTNAPASPNNSYPLPYNPTWSAAEEIQSWAPGSKVVKALNHINYMVMANPKMGQGPVTITICGDDADAKARVARLITQSGLEAVDVGPLIGARLIEALAKLFSAYRYTHPDMTFEVHLRTRPNDLGPVQTRPSR